MRIFTVVEKPAPGVSCEVCNGLLNGRTRNSSRARHDNPKFVERHGALRRLDPDPTTRIDAYVVESEISSSSTPLGLRADRARQTRLEP